MADLSPLGGCERYPDLVDVFALGHEALLRRGQAISGTRPEDVESRPEDHADQQFDNQAADDDDGEGALRVGADVVRHRGGQQPESRDQHGHHDGTEAEDGAFFAASRTAMPRARSWLMYSTMITPIWTETPNSARKPRPDETLKWVPVTSRLRNPPSGDERDHGENQANPLPRAECGIQDEEISSSVTGTMMARRRLARCWLSYSPVQSR